MADGRETLREVVDAYQRAVFVRDVDALLALYDPGVRVFDLWARWTYAGAVEWRGAVEEWFGGLGDERVRVTMDEVRTVESPELATLTAIGTYAALSADGRPLRAMQNRLTWVLARRRGRLAIVHEHTSAPVRHDDLKALLRYAKPEGESPR